MEPNNVLERATGGQNCISDDMFSASRGRAIIFNDPGLVWIAEHGQNQGYHKDSGRYRLLPFLSKLGAEFEAAYIRHEAPHAVRLLQHNGEVRNKDAFEKTVEHLQKGTKFLWQAALWWYPEQIYGVADGIVHTSWLYKRYPHLKPTVEEPPHYVVIDFKFSQNLDSTAKKDHLEHATTQTRIYSYMLGQLQGHMPRRAYIISRDTIDAPLIVEVNLKLDEPLDDELTDLRDAYLDIKLRGANWLPWASAKTALNPMNKADEPFHDAKQEILREKVRPRSLLMLPGVGQETARKMRLHGFKDIDDLLSRNIDRLRFEDVDGIYPALAERLRAVLKANKTGKASDIPSNLVPRRAEVSIMLDMEYVSGLKPDWDEWPLLPGTPMIFMIGCGYKEGGKWIFRRFTSAENTHQAEAKMLRSFLSFLRGRGVFDPSKTAALYHFSSAEVWQARQAAQRHGLWQLETLPFVDLRDVFLQGPVCLPGCWNFGLKEIAQALGEYAPRYKVEWPDGMSGQAAQVAGWAAYEEEEPLKTPEMKIIAEYLEKDCVALERILAFLRNSQRAEKQQEATCNGWYRFANPVPAVSAASVGNGGGWYQRAVGRCDGELNGVRP